MVETIEWSRGNSRRAELLRAGWGEMGHVVWRHIDDAAVRTTVAEAWLAIQVG
jgi:hypothetical protein